MKLDLLEAYKEKSREEFNNILQKSIGAISISLKFGTESEKELMMIALTSLETIEYILKENNG